MTTLDFSTIDFITELFVRVDDTMPNQQKHSQAKLHASELVTLGLLFALKGVGNRAFYRWISRDLRGLFPHLPERTRLFRLLAQHHGQTACFLAPPTLLGVADSFGIELRHRAFAPVAVRAQRQTDGRSDKQTGAATNRRAQRQTERQEVLLQPPLDRRRQAGLCLDSS